MRTGAAPRDAECSVHVMGWMYSGRDSVTGVTTGDHFRNGVTFLHLELLYRSEFIRRVVGAYNANGTMLRRSDQLLLTPENGHFEGITTHLRAKEGPNARRGESFWGCQNIEMLCIWTFLRLQMRATLYLQSGRSPTSGGVGRTVATLYHSHYKLPRPSL